MTVKKILILTTWFPSKFEPTNCIFVKNVVNAQVKNKDFKFTVVVPRPYFPKIFDRWMPQKIQDYNCLEFYESTNGYETYRPYYLKISFLGEYVMSFFYYLSILFLIKRKNIDFDLIHSHGIFPDGFVAIKLGKKLKVPVFCHLHDSYLEKINLRIPKLLKEIFLKSAKLISVSEFQKRTVLKLYPSLKNIEVVYNGIESQNFHFEKKDMKKKFVFVGNLIPTKGLDTLIEAMYLLKDTTLYIDVYGKGYNRKLYEEKIKAYNLENNIIFKGIVENTKIPELLSNYSALIHPSKYETFGIVLIEALASGIPVIASDVCAVPEIVKSEEYGFTFKVDDSVELSHCIKKAIVKIWDYDRISNYGKQFDIVNTVNHINTLYKNEILFSDGKSHA